MLSHDLRCSTDHGYEDDSSLGIDDDERFREAHLLGRVEDPQVWRPDQVVRKSKLVVRIGGVCPKSQSCQKRMVRTLHHDMLQEITV